ncbi:MAG: phosphoribosylformylglycinamidine synthase I [Treponema sp.]
MKVKALILHATGTNRDVDAKYALELAGAEGDIVHINQLKSKEKKWKDYSLLVIPGGFSYADALGAGKILSLELMHYFFDEISEFIHKRKPIIGICNGFQVLIKTGILPGSEEGILSKDAYRNREATLTYNENAHFECRDVILKAVDSKCIWTAGITEPIICPIAHGEGRFLTSSREVLDKLIVNKQIALKYMAIKADSEGIGDIQDAKGCYPYNPNGSCEDIAGISDATGLVLGLMPHTENNVVQREVDYLERRNATKACLAIWKNGVQYAKNM